MANVNITDKPFATDMADGNSLFGNFGGEMKQITLTDFRKAINQNDEQVLNELAFYIDINKASSLGSTRVDVGGNMGMRSLWENAGTSVIMDANGNYCELNHNDCRYTAEGDYLLNEDGTVVSAFAHGDFMKIIPQTYGRVQVVTVGSTTFTRCWFSLVPLPGGYIIPQIVVGKFKAGLVGGAMRSLPGLVPDNTKSIRQFWNVAQVRSKNHGLANLDFRNHLLFHMMSKYGWRDSQNSKTTDGTLVWGVGLDGTEGLASGETTSSSQRNVKTGGTLSLGDFDGKVAVALSNGNTAHCVNVAGFENPWGQYWEMMGGLCSVGTDVYCWRSNIVPASNPTAETFDGIDHVLLTRPTTSVWGMNIISSEEGQGVYMIPKQSLSGVSYGDNFGYNANGQMWLTGGSMQYASSCGLAMAYTDASWGGVNGIFSTRLAYYGPLTKVSSSQFKNLAN